MTTLREPTPFSKPAKAPRKGNNARKGRGWEAQLRVWHDDYRKHGEAWIVHTAPGIKRTSGAGKTFEATYSSKGPPDFVGCIVIPGVGSGRAVVFDAKDCDADRWPLARLEDHQAADLSAAARAGGFAFVALRGPFGDRSGVGRWVLPWEPMEAWSGLRPHWEAWRSGRAERGEASLSAEDVSALGFLMGIDGWLPIVRGLLA